MLDVVATTPSKPLGACVVVTLDILPRKSWVSVAGSPVPNWESQPIVIRQNRALSNRPVRPFRERAVY